MRGETGRRTGREGGRPRSTRLIFHKFEKHTRGSRCVNLNFSAAMGRRVRQGVAEEEERKRMADVPRVLAGIVVWKCHRAYGAEFRRTLFVSPGASVFFLSRSRRIRVVPRGDSSVVPETPSFPAELRFPFSSH